MPLQPPDIEAEIRFLSTGEGGRHGPCATGYRPHHDFGLGDVQFDAIHEYTGRQWVAPGETVIAQLSFMGTEYPKYLGGRLYAGLRFTVQEGARIVGRGRVLKVLNETLIAAER